MRTHELGKALSRLGQILQSGPNVELEDVKNALVSGFSRQEVSTDIAVNLSTLANLALIDKGKWLQFIRENDLPLRIRPRDASRDVLGKLLRYLEDNAEARERLKQNIMKKTAHASPELMKALSLILGDTGGASSR